MSKRMRLSDAIQDYLREIYKLESGGIRATTTAIAGRLGVSAPSATGMVKRLAALGLVEHERYRGVVLTEAGRRVALEVTRHHRLLERYLAEMLGLPLELVHGEADRLEHALSEELEARIDESLGFPSHDPHGHPIPDTALTVPKPSIRALSTLATGESATVRSVPDDDADLLRYLADLNLLPGARVEVRSSAPFAGPLTVRVGRAQHAIGRELAGVIGVE